MTFYNSVRTAAKWLDIVHPAWYEKVDTNKLDMNSCSSCVLGQVFGEYVRSCSKYGIPDRPNNAFGYLADREEWIAEINNRLAPKLTEVENRIAELEASLKQEKAKLEALRNPEVSVTMTKSQWMFVATYLNANGYDYPEITKAAKGE